MKNLKKYFQLTTMAFATVAVLFLHSCKEDEKTPLPTPSSYQGVFILNEGGFNKGNASVDFYNPTDTTITDDIFTKANNRPLGDIFQSMYKHNGKFYLVVNNSSKVEVVNADNFKSVGTINNLVSPRFMLVPTANTAKAYITDLFAGHIHVIDLISNAKTKSINLNGFSEGMVEASGKIFVNNWSNKKVYTIDPATDMIKDSIALTDVPNGIAVDANNKVWVLVDSTATSKAKFLRINPANNSIEATIEFATGSADKMVIANGKVYYITGAGLFEMPISSTTLPATPKKAGYFYSLGVDSKEGSVYVADPLNFNQRGIVTRIWPNGKESSFRVGIIPGGFFFNN